MQWRLTLKEFGPNIQNISGIDNVVSYTLIRLPSENMDREKSITMNDSRWANELFAYDNDEYEEVNLPLSLPLVQRKQ